jgi:putative ABC transport system ATP-binding protein
MASRGCILEARSISRKSLTGDRIVLQTINLQVRAGDRIGISGPIGSGKTLLLRSLAMLDQYDGEILWQAAPVPPAEIPNFRRHVIYLHQQPAIVDGTVEDNLRLPFGFRTARGKTFDRKVVLALLETAGRGDAFLLESVDHLSGGERQLVALIRAVQLEPTVLLLDEPTSAMDAETARSIENLIDRWQNDAAEQRAFLWVSHSPEQLARVAPRRIVLDNGCVRSEDML